MIEAFINTLEFFPRGLVYVALGLLVLVLAKFSKDLVTRYRIDQEVIQKSNLAAAVGLSGYFSGVVLVFLGAVYQPLPPLVSDRLGFNRAFGEEVLWVFLYSLAGIVALNLASFVMDQLVLYKFSVQKELVEDRNVGTGAVEFGNECCLRIGDCRSNIRGGWWTRNLSSLLRHGPGGVNSFPPCFTS